MKTMLTPAPALQLPAVTLGDELGRGSFGGVYRGHHRWLDVDVAVKVITGIADPSALELALREARLMARLDHPNLLRIYDAGHFDAGIYLILELMDGTCAPLRRLPAERALSVTRQLLQGLQALHDARVLHRDIKPANCLVRARDGRVKLADLGIAIEQSTRAKGQPETAGTLPFMAPELFEDPPRFSPASDLYALGMTLACLLLDQNPFPRAPAPALVAWIAMGERPSLTRARPELPHRLTALIDRLLARRSDDRPQTAAEALAALDDERPQTAAAPTAPATGERVGAWVLGAPVYRSSNWQGDAVTHAHTGAAARLTRLQPDGPLGRSSALILAAAQRAARLDHPAIVDVVDWGLHQGRAYVVTTPQGCSLDDLVRAGGPRGEREALTLAVALAEGLRYLHGEGLVYQMIEPGSVAIAADARSVQLRWPVFCVPAGSPPAVDGRSQRVMVLPYAAPEAIENRSAIEASADLYGLGEVLYFLLAGQAACAGAQGVVPTLLAKMEPRDVRAQAPMTTAPTADLVNRLRSPQPADRPASAAQVAQALQRQLRLLGG